MITAMTRVFLRGSAPGSGRTTMTFHSRAGTVTASWPVPISSRGPFLPVPPAPWGPQAFSGA
jgi:hypothetical protein